MNVILVTMDIHRLQGKKLASISQKELIAVEQHIQLKAVNYLFSSKIYNKYE